MTSASNLGWLKRVFISSLHNASLHKIDVRQILHVQFKSKASCNMSITTLASRLLLNSVCNSAKPRTLSSCQAFAKRNIKCIFTGIQKIFACYLWIHMKIHGVNYFSVLSGSLSLLTCTVKRLQFSQRVTFETIYHASESFRAYQVVRLGQFVDSSWLQRFTTLMVVVYPILWF